MKTNDSANTLTIRGYFAAAAPKEVPSWFEPAALPPPPEEPTNPQDFKRHADATHKWRATREVARFAQWPWYWADEVLKVGGATP